MTIAEKIAANKAYIKASFEAFDREFAAVNSRIDATTAALNAVETKRGLSNPQARFENTTEATDRCFREMQEEIKRNNEEFQRFVDQSIMNHQF